MLTGYSGRARRTSLNSVNRKFNFGEFHFYDIDVVINRTLVYGSLTAMLVLVYFGGVTATQAIFRTFTGQEEQPQLAIVVSTLVIAALYSGAL